MSFTLCKLRDAVELAYGKSLPARDRKDGDIPVYGSGGIGGYHNEALIEGPGIILGRKGTIGSVFYEKSDFYPIDTVYYVKTDPEKIEQRFAYYLLKSLPLKQLNTDAAVPGLNRDIAYDVKINLPDVTTQKEILKNIENYDDLIENNRRRIQLLEESARLLYKEWFVHLRFPGHEHVNIKDGVPEGWELGTIGELAEVKSGYAFKSKDWLEDGNPVIKIKNITEAGEINFSGCQCVDDGVADKAVRFKLSTGDMLIAMTGATVGKVGLMPRMQSTYYLNQRVGKFFQKYALNVTPFLFCLSKSNYFQKNILNLAGGAAQPNISGGQIESIETLVPGSKVLNWFNESAEPIFLQREILLEQNVRLAEARDVLLPRLMNGELTA